MHLLDINVLIAMADLDHENHQTVEPSSKNMAAMAGPLAHWLKTASSAFSDMRNTLKGLVPHRVPAWCCENFLPVLAINFGPMPFP